jgi:hypothetical protein
MSLVDEIKKEAGKSNSITDIKESLIRRGYLEKDIDDSLKSIINIKDKEKSKNNTLLTAKELLDRIGYGFSSQQFINILFMLSGASLLLIGIINGIKNAVNYILTGVLKEFSKAEYIGKKMIGYSGIVFGLSFLGMAVAVVMRSPIIFSLSVIIGSLGIIAHGDLYVKFSESILKNERRSTFLKLISYFGIMITTLSMLLAAFIIDLFSVKGQIISITISSMSLSLKAYGYLIAFEMTAIMFILSGYILSFIDEGEKYFNKNTDILESFKSYSKQSLESTGLFSKNPKIYILTIATILTTIVQIVGNSYYGIFIYENFKDQCMGGFMNVAVIFVIALITSMIGGLLTKGFTKSLGEAPMLVFGTLLIALLPITMYFNPRLYSIGLASALSVVGASIVGIAQGLIASRLMNEQELERYFSSLGFVSILPIILFTILGAIVAQALSLELLFLILGISLVLIIMPLYFIIVLIVDSEYKRKINIQPIKVPPR